ncbi:MAG: hypothetical protein RIS73_2283 [Bacteroidota bacterium]|jgi:hypothetical protein
MLVHQCSVALPGYQTTALAGRAEITTNKAEKYGCYKMYNF